MCYTLIMLSPYPKETETDKIVEVFITNKKTGISDRMSFTAGEHFSLMKYIGAMLKQHIEEKGGADDAMYEDCKYKITKI